MPMVFEKGTDRYEYVLGAVRSGQIMEDEMMLVLMLAEFTGKPVMEVQSRLMDFKIGIRQVRRDPETFKERG